MSCSSFSRELKISIKKSEEPNYNRGKVVETTAGNCYLQFPDKRLHESRAVLFETEGRAIASKEEIN